MILLVGAGHMGSAYAAVLKDLDAAFLAVGRGDQSARSLEQTAGAPVIRGGVSHWLTHSADSIPEKAIVAVSATALSEVTCQLIRFGIKSILVEKPGGFSAASIRSVADEALTYGVDLRVAYNRRYYGSTLKAREIILDDGGVTSFCFEFTEWEHAVLSSGHPEALLNEWFLNNSSHVVDLAFYLGGKPVELSAYSAGGTAWHPRGSVYAGAGITETGALFSYQANWAAPGRWGVEMLTHRHRLIFRPMEKLQIQRLSSLSIEPVDIDDSLDVRFKPGIYRQTQAFLNNDTSVLLDIHEQAHNLSIYEKMNPSHLRRAGVTPS